jgi:hypothetical protein
MTDNFSSTAGFILKTDQQVTLFVINSKIIEYGLTESFKINI